MHGLYLAVDSETGETFTFTGFEDLKEFAKKNEYAYDYYSIPIVQEFYDVDLFIKN